MIVVVLTVLLALAAGCGRPADSKPSEAAESVKQTRTSPELLARLDALGARYWINNDGQVYCLLLNHLPILHDDLAILRELPHVSRLSLRGVNVHGGEITNDSLRLVAEMPALERLDISANSSLTDDGIRHLRAASKLDRLNISSTGATAACLPYLSELPVTQLHASVFHNGRIEVNADTVQHLRKMPLQILHGVACAKSAVPLLAELKHLKLLPIWSGRDIRDVDLKAIAHIEGITALRIQLTNGWSDFSHLVHLKSLPTLKHVILSVREEQVANTIDRAGLLHLRDIPSLKTLYPYWATDELLDVVSEISQLEYVVLTDTSKASQAGIADLCRMPNLRQLVVPPQLVDENIAAVVSKATSLRHLSFGHFTSYYLGRYVFNPFDYRQPPREPTFSAEDLRPLSDLNNLELLDLAHWAVTDEMLKPLGQIDSLRLLNLSHTKITNAGLDHLFGLNNLRILRIEGTNVDPDAADRLGVPLGAEVQNEHRWGDGMNAGIGVDPQVVREINTQFY